MVNSFAMATLIVVVHAVFHSLHIVSCNANTIHNDTNKHVTTIVYTNI